MSDIRIKRIYDPPTPDDGIRVLVDRLWPRGLRKSDVSMDYWLKDVAPSTELRRWFGHDPAHWAAFQISYRQELSRGSVELSQLSALADKERVTLLYAAHDPHCNHALVLQDFLRKNTSKQAQHE
ncbi:DUF488 domain-containing protein [Komagataeibacter medellinensis]|uniref:DUF488 domain-containing protein n=1 Tax=Komagataeibacter medellinensis TaxID=1177712 RepID=A0ABQ6VSE9_9PROT|nr:DUF488 domain-containing protein [Komagataeibacter medellinensis]KAB8123114.1 DUF488 domain-containing protein [Komagataeibacter medellinensis]